MLYTIESSGDLRQIISIPHATEYSHWHSRLTDQEFDAIYDELLNRIDTKDIDTSSWIPGSDWTGTVFFPIWDSACNRDFDASAKFFGLILWKVVMEHTEEWSFGKYEKDGTPIAGTTYFRLNQNAN